MRICSVCYAEANNHQKFCQECGNTLPSLTEKEVVENTLDSQGKEDYVHVEAPAKRRNSTNMKKSTKWIVGSILAIVVLLIGTHFFIQNLIDPMGRISAAQKAYATEDYEEFMSLFEISEDTFVNEKGFADFIEAEFGSENFFKEIVKKAEQVTDSGFPETLTDENGNKVLTLLPERYLLVYEKVDFQIHPIQVVGHTTVKSTTVTLGENQSIDLTNEDSKLGKFTPGNHTFEAKLVDDISEITVPVDVEIVGEESNKANIVLDFSDRTVQLSSDYPEATVYINGKKQSKNAEELVLYTLPLDGSTEIYAEHSVDGKSKKSKPLSLTIDDTHIVFEDVEKQRLQEQQEDEKQQVMELFREEYEQDARDLFYDFRSDYLDAVNYADFSYVERYFADGSALKKDYQKFIIDHDSFDYSYDYDFLSNDILDFKVVDEQTFTLTTYEIFNFYTSTEENWHYEREKLYTIQLQNDVLKILNIEDASPVKKTKI